jgi:hypothetical protein
MWLIDEMQRTAPQIAGASAISALSEWLPNHLRDMSPHPMIEK